MPIYEVCWDGDPSTSHYVVAPADPKLAKIRIKQHIQSRECIEEVPHSSIQCREMGPDEFITICADYKPMTHTVDEWAYVFEGMKENISSHAGLAYIGHFTSEPKIKNLWGDVPTKATGKLPIYHILDNQGHLLAKETNGKVTAKVALDGPVGTTDYKFQVRFYLYAPTLGQYCMDIIKIFYPVGMFPLIMTDVLGVVDFRCHDEIGFSDKLEEILSSDPVHEAISSLVSMINADNWRGLQ